jgi:hypothetical protein
VRLSVATALIFILRLVTMTDFAQRLQQRGPQFRDLTAKIKELQWVDSQFRKAGIEKERLSKIVAKRQAELEELKKIT